MSCLSGCYVCALVPFESAVCGDPDESVTPNLLNRLPYGDAAVGVLTLWACRKFAERGEGISHDSDAGAVFLAEGTHILQGYFDGLHLCFIGGRHSNGCRLEGRTRKLGGDNSCSSSILVNFLHRSACPDLYVILGKGIQ